MKKLVIWLSIITLFSSIVFSGCKKDVQNALPVEDGQTLVIYAHSSLQGLIEKSLSMFEERFKCNVEVEYNSSQRDLITRLTEEADNPVADIIFGIDNGNYYLALENSVMQPYAAEGLSSMDDKLIFDGSDHFIPFTYGYLAFLYDSSMIEEPPQNFGKLQDGMWRNMFLMSHPETSSNGLAFLLWAVSVFGENGYGHLLRSIKNNVYHISSSWENSLSMFTAGEAPFFLGYTTTPAYYIETENSYRYISFVPEEGTYLYIESIGVVSGSKSLSLAKNYIEFVLSRDFQQHIATSKWLYPVFERGGIPASFRDIEVPELIVNDRLRANLTSSRIDSWVNRWTQLMLD